MKEPFASTISAKKEILSKIVSCVRHNLLEGNLLDSYISKYNLLSHTEILFSINLDKYILTSLSIATRNTRWFYN